MPPIWIYIPLDAKLSPPSFGIFKSVCWYGKFVFILVLCMRSVHQKWRRAMLRATDSWKMCSRAWTISTHAILSHSMIELSLLADSLDCLCFWQTRSTTFCLFPVILHSVLNFNRIHLRQNHWSISDYLLNYQTPDSSDRLYYCQTRSTTFCLFPVYQTMGGSIVHSMVYRSI